MAFKINKKKQYTLFKQLYGKKNLKVDGQYGMYYLQAKDESKRNIVDEMKIGRKIPAYIKKDKLPTINWIQ